MGLASHESSTRTPIAESPITSNTPDTGDVLATFDSLINRSLDPVEAGLVLPNSRSWNIDDITYVEPRVESWDHKSTSEKNIVKLRTMYRLTDAGHEFEESLREIVRQGVAEFSTKQISAYRVCYPLIRKLSADELPRLVWNVMGLGDEDKFPDLMDLPLIGGGLAPKAIDIEYRGDNSNDLFGRALEKQAKINGDISRDEMYRLAGRLFVPGLLTIATANGNRQLSTQANYDAWLQGFIDFRKLENLPPAQRALAYGRIAVSSAKHVIAQTDAI